jgi:[CysO sulfur-carrier protein]-S-L-cysteine hydrolase
MSDRLVVSKKQLAVILDHVDSCLPEEGCGILGGKGSVVKQVIPVTNQLHSAKGFFMTPQEQFLAMKGLEENGYEMIAIYHSHPTGGYSPSQVDIKNHFYPGDYQVILSREDLKWRISVFSIQRGEFDEILLTVKRNS